MSSRHIPFPHPAQLNFTTFAAIANAAMGTTLDPPFDPFADDMSALIAAYILEDVGVTAYKARPRPCLSHHLALPSRSPTLWQRFARYMEIKCAVCVRRPWQRPR